jgi:hypothetical protein
VFNLIFSDFFHVKEDTLQRLGVVVVFSVLKIRTKNVAVVGLVRE